MAVILRWRSTTISEKQIRKQSKKSNLNMPSYSFRNIHKSVVFSKNNCKKVQNAQIMNLTIYINRKCVIIDISNLKKDRYEN